MNVDILIFARSQNYFTNCYKVRCIREYTFYVSHLHFLVIIYFFVAIVKTVLAVPICFSIQLPAVFSRG